MAVTSAIIVEPRNHSTLDYVVANVRTALPDVPIYLHHGTRNKELSQAIANATSNVHLVDTKAENFSTMKQHSDYMMRPDVYASLPKGHTVVFQTDAAFCDPGAKGLVDKINSFAQYSYVGAPWANRFKDRSTDVGNGGFSLRDTRMMEQLARGKRLHKVEDIAFTESCKRDTECLMPDVKTALGWANQFTFKKARHAPNDAKTSNNCLAMKEPPIGFHKPQRPCSRSYACPSRDAMPEMRELTDAETRAKIHGLRGA